MQLKKKASVDVGEDLSQAGFYYNPYAVEQRVLEYAEIEKPIDHRNHTVERLNEIGDVNYSSNSVVVQPDLKIKSLESTPEIELDD